MHTRSQHQNGPLSLPPVASSTLLSPSLSLAGDGFDTRLTRGHPVTREREREKASLNGSETREREREAPSTASSLFAMASSSASPSLPLPPSLATETTKQHRPSSHYNSPYWTTNSGAPVWNNNNSSTVGVRGTSFFVSKPCRATPAQRLEGLRSSPSFARSWSPKDLDSEQRAREGGEKLALCGEKRVSRTVASERESGERRSIQNKEAAAGGGREKREAELDFSARRLGSIFFLLNLDPPCSPPPKKQTNKQARSSSRTTTSSRSSPT